MAWSRIDDQIRHHPKLLKAGPEAAWMFVAGLSYCAEYRTDGFIPAEAVPTLTTSRKPATLARRLVHARKPGGEHGLWERVEGGFRVHDYLVYQPSAEDLRQREETDRQRLRAARGGGRGGQGEPSGSDERNPGARSGGEPAGAGGAPSAENEAAPVPLRVPVSGSRRRPGATRPEPEAPSARPPSGPEIQVDVPPRSATEEARDGRLPEASAPSSSGPASGSVVSAPKAVPDRVMATGPAAERRDDVGTTSSRRRPVPIPIPIPIPDPQSSQDPPPVCAPDPRTPARDEEHTHGDGRKNRPKPALESARREVPAEASDRITASPAGFTLEALEVDDTDAEAILRHLRAMPPPIRWLATPEHATRFAAARLTGLSRGEVLRAITAAGLKLGKHAGASPKRPSELEALANHVGSFLANQTPLADAVEDRGREEPAPAAVERFLRRWGELYARIERTSYVVTDEDRERAAELVGLVQRAAKERAARAGGDEAKLEERIAEHWIRAYLGDEGVNGYLVKARHALRYMARHVGTYGVPKGMAMRAPARPRVEIEEAPMPRDALARCGREFLATLTGTGPEC